MKRAGARYSALGARVRGWGSEDLRCQLRNRCPEMRSVIIPELLDQRVPIKSLLHDPSLYAFPTAVDEAYLSESRRVRGPNILFNDVRDVARRKSVKVERIFGWNFVHQPEF